MVPLLSSTNAIKAAAATGAVSAAQAVTSGTIEVPAALYTVISICLALIGVHLSRMVTIEKENLRLGRRQSWRETGPLTWIAVLIVCPFIWHFKIAIPWASLIGLGTGYSVRIILALLGAGAASAARGFVRQVSDSLRDAPAIEGDDEEGHQRAILGRLDQPEEPGTHDREP